MEIIDKTKNISFYQAEPLKRLITDIRVISYKRININGVVIKYVFKITTPYNKWFIEKRYSEIKTIFEKIVPKYKNLKFPSFPPKRLFSTKESTITERKNKFDEIFLFILNNIDILTSPELIKFLSIEKTIIILYMKNCILINENKYENYDFINSISLKNKKKMNYKNIKYKKNPKNDSNCEDKKKGEKNSGNNNNTIRYIDEDNINDNDNEDKDLFNCNQGENWINIKDQKTEKAKKVLKMSNIIDEMVNSTNYFICFEEYKLSSGKFNSRSQVSFHIVREFLRNLEVHSSHRCEIIKDFMDYMKYNKKWKKFNNNEITALFIGINKEECLEDYYLLYNDYFHEKKISKNEKNSTKSFLYDRSTLSSTPDSINKSEDICNLNNFDDYKIQLHGLLSIIGQFNSNYYGSKYSLVFLSKLFENQFNPEVDLYVSIFRNLKIEYILQMNLIDLAKMNNYSNQKLCFDILRIYLGNEKEDIQIKKLNKLNFDKLSIDNFLRSNDRNVFLNEYNIE